MKYASNGEVIKPESLKASVVAAFESGLERSGMNRDLGDKSGTANPEKWAKK